MSSEHPGIESRVNAPKLEIGEPEFGEPEIGRRWQIGLIVWTILELAALAAVAISQPILDVFGKAPEVFVEARADSGDVLMFVLAVALLPGLVIGAVLLVARAATGPRGFRVVATAFAAGLSALFGIQVARQVAERDAVVFVVASGIAIAGTFAYVRTRWLHTWLRFLSVAPVLFAAMFVVTAPAGDLVLDRTEAEAVDLSPGARGPVVLLVLDELPTTTLLDARGNIDAVRFPGFAALAADSTWFRNTTAVSSNTLFAIPAIFTGRYPAESALGTGAGQHPDNLFRLLGSEYRFNVTEYVTALCNTARCDPTDPANAPAPEFATGGVPDGDRPKPLSDLLGDAWRTYRTQLTGAEVTLNPTAMQIDDELVIPDAPDTTTGRVSNIAQPARYAEWLARIDGDTATPQLSVLHSVIPHHPWRLDGAGVRYRPIGGTEVGFSKFAWLDMPGAVTTMRQRHIEMVRYADTLVAALQSRLQRLGIWDDATVIVTADHGAAFTPDAPFRSWTEETQPEIVGVPLFVHGPGFAAGANDDRAAQSVDIVPTIAATQDVDIPWEVDGVDLATLDETRDSHPFAVKGFPNEAIKRPYELIDLDVSNHLIGLEAATPDAATTGGGDLGTWRTGPRGDLIERGVDEFALADDRSITIDLLRGSLASTTRAPGDQGVSAQVVGRLQGNASVGDTVAIAVDDIIVSTATIDEDPKRSNDLMNVSAFVSPSLVDTAGHRVRLFLVDGAGEATTLRPIRVR